MHFADTSCCDSIYFSLACYFYECALWIIQFTSGSFIILENYATRVLLKCFAVIDFVEIEMQTNQRKVFILIRFSQIPTDPERFLSFFRYWLMIHWGIFRNSHFHFRIHLASHCAQRPVKFYKWIYAFEPNFQFRFSMATMCSSMFSFHSFFSTTAWNMHALSQRTSCERIEYEMIVNITWLVWPAATQWNRLKFIPCTIWHTHTASHLRSSPRTFTFDMRCHCYF